MLGLPILGHIPVIDAAAKRRLSKGAAAAMSPSLCVAHDRKGTQAEAYREIRTAVYSAPGGWEAGSPNHQPQSGRRQDDNRRQSGPLNGRGGQKILLVDADFRRPRVHEIMEIDNSVGLKALSKEKWKSATQPATRALATFG